MYPDYENVKGKMYVKLEAGDILFIPVYWWHHVKSSKGRNLAINYWYTPNYLNRLFISGLENNNFNWLNETN